MKNRIVVRLRTSTWVSDRGVHQKRDILFQKRKCKGFNVLREDAAVVPAHELVSSLVNLSSCGDGYYEAVMCAEHTDWETGYVDSWSWKLIPLTESTPHSDSE